MKKSLVAAIALVAAAGAVHAQTVEFRIVERRGQTQWNTTQPTSVPANDNLLDFAVQARVVGGAQNLGIGNFNFNVVTTSGEAESRGTLARAKISNAGTGAYDTNPATMFNTNSTLGQGGLAATYIYLAGINGAFNGVINSNSGTYVNNPAEQDIGLVTGAPIGGSLLTTFGAGGLTDANGDPVPDTWTDGTTAPLDSALANTFLGANGNFIDLYHFRYTITNNTLDRVIHFAITGAAAQTFSSLASSSGVWGPAGITDATVNVGQGLDFHVIVPAPASAALLGLGGLMAARRRRTA